MFLSFLKLNIFFFVDSRSKFFSCRHSSRQNWHSTSNQLQYSRRSSTLCTRSTDDFKCFADSGPSDPWLMFLKFVLFSEFSKLQIEYQAKHYSQCQKYHIAFTKNYPNVSFWFCWNMILIKFLNNTRILFTSYLRRNLL